MKTKVQDGWRVYCNKLKAYREDVLWADDAAHTFSYCGCGHFEGCLNPRELSAYRVVIIPGLRMIWLHVPDEQKVDVAAELDQALRKKNGAAAGTVAGRRSRKLLAEER